MQTSERPPLVLTPPEPEQKKEEPVVETKVEDKNQQNIFDLLLGEGNYKTVPMDS